MDKDLRILEADKEWARLRINELEAEILALGPDFNDAFTQTSETWHDNAPFEILRDRQAVLVAERDSLKKILRRSLTSFQNDKVDAIDIGCTVETVDLMNNKITYFIAGDWTPHAGKAAKGVITVSSASPIAKKMIGLKRNDCFKHNDTLKTIKSINW